MAPITPLFSWNASAGDLPRPMIGTFKFDLRKPAPMPGSSEANQSAWNCVFCRLLDLDEKYRKAHWDGYGRAANGNMFGLGTNRDTGLH
jgi:hypothetical protein